MQRVLPSQVLAAIDDTFPWVGKFIRGVNGVREQELTGALLSSVGPLLAMIRSVPDELLVLNPEDAAQYVFAVESVHTAVEAWRNNPHSGSAPTIGPHSALHGRSPFTAIYDYLSACPDEAPARSTHDLSFVADPALRESIRIDLSNAERARAHGEYKAATVLAGACVEALLLDSLERHDQSLVSVAVDRLKPARGTLKLPRDRWHLGDYAAIASDLDLIDAETLKSVELAGDYRNLIHPGRALRLAKAASLATAHTALGAAHAVINELERRCSIEP